ncbi:MAG: ester cyclase [Anaerolineae bacterium]|nr:ester cyclase [Anaerolineae bacterium]
MDRIARLVAELTDAWNVNDVELVTSFYAWDYEGTDVGEAALQRGPEGIRQTLARYGRAFPDLRFIVGETIVQGNRVALIWTARGTHQGIFMNIPPTGRTIEVRGVSLLTIEDGKVTHGLYIWDVAGMLRAIGLLPEL